MVALPLWFPKDNIIIVDFVLRLESFQNTELQAYKNKIDQCLLVPQLTNNNENHIQKDILERYFV
jgi:hypothetical protein